MSQGIAYRLGILTGEVLPIIIGLAVGYKLIGYFKDKKQKKNEDLDNK